MRQLNCIYDHKEYFFFNMPLFMERISEEERQSRENRQKYVFEKM